MKKLKLIGMTGKARSGKDTAAEYLKNRHRFHTYAFADPLKKAAAEMFGIPLDMFYDQSVKEKIIPEWGFSPRQIAQLLGTEGGRKLFREDIWVKRAELEWKTFQRCTNPEYMNGMIITDLRFENESKMVRDLGGYVIHIHRKDAVKVNEHESENGVEVFVGDYVIDNNGSFDDLYDQLEAAYEDILNDDS
jgi:hypothetical protein